MNKWNIFSQKDCRCFVSNFPIFWSFPAVYFDTYFTLKLFLWWDIREKMRTGYSQNNLSVNILIFDIFFALFTLKLVYFLGIERSAPVYPTRDVGASLVFRIANLRYWNHFIPVLFQLLLHTLKDQTWPFFRQYENFSNLFPFFVVLRPKTQEEIPLVDSIDYF